MSRAVDFICCTVWNLFVYGGTAYLVVQHGWSPWWFALAVCITANPSKEGA